jgi:surfactin synthase thioesterase subunit
VIFNRLMTGFFPRQVDARVLCILSEENKRRREYAPDQWKRFAYDVRSVTVPGGHFTALTAHMDALASTLDNWLKQTEPAHAQPGAASDGQ